FLNSYQSGAEDLYAAVVRQMRSKPSGYYDLILTGHSLGGAHAYLAAIDFQIRDRSLANVTSIYTYGAPRVGNQAFADYFDRIPFRFSARVTAARDMIPTLPSHLHGYVHVREEFYIRRDAEV
ncbi:alpha/beta-hydrolase, partial [Ramicandelaber brevisporus]